MRNSVSVVIPTLGRQSELHEALRSVVSQITDGDEVLVIDDGSTPPIELDRELARHQQIRLIRRETSGGPSAARNLGVKQAKGDLVAFLDSDDVWLAGKLKLQRDTIARHEGELVAVVCGWNEHFRGQPFRKRIPKAARSPSDHFLGCWFCPGSTLLIRKEAFEICGPYNEEMRRLEDYEWFLRFAGKGGALLVVDEYGAVINRGANNNSSLVEAAISQIVGQFADDTTLSRRVRRGMMAYLHLELAGSYRNESSYFRAIRHIFTSLLYRPRLSLQLRNWWTAK